MDVHPSPDLPAPVPPDDVSPLPSSGAKGAPPRFTRRQYVVDRDFQYSTLAFTLVTTLTYVVVIAFSISAWMIASIQAQEGSMTTGQARQHWIVMGVSLLTLTGLLGVQILVLTHRVAGPARKLAAALRKLVHGEYSEFVTLRRSDYLQELGSALNTLTRTLSDRDQAVREAAALIDEAIRHAPPEVTPLQTMERLRQAHALLQSARAPEPPPSSASLPAVAPNP